MPRPRKYQPLANYLWWSNVVKQCGRPASVLGMAQRQLACPVRRSSPTDGHLHAPEAAGDAVTTRQEPTGGPSARHPHARGTPRALWPALAPPVRAQGYCGGGRGWSEAAATGGLLFSHADGFTYQLRVQVDRRRYDARCQSVWANLNSVLVHDDRLTFAAIRLIGGPRRQPTRQDGIIVH